MLYKFKKRKFPSFVLLILFLLLSVSTNNIRLVRADIISDSNEEFRELEEKKVQIIQDNGISNKDEGNNDQSINKVSTENTDQQLDNKNDLEIDSNLNNYSIQALDESPIGTKYYYIKQGETLFSIAKRFQSEGLTVSKLQNWNDIVDVSSIKVGDVISINGYNDYNNYNLVNRQFNNKQLFLDFASEYALSVATEYSLYPSVMVAQAALETGYGSSNLAVKANNFFGIKADNNYDGYTIVMPTWEMENGIRVEKDALFRFYRDYRDSFIDNAQKLRYGLNWNQEFYKGTWLENTRDFRDATLFLNQRYANDIGYNEKLNTIILNYKLYQHDPVVFKDNSYPAMIAKITDISNLPLNHYNGHNNVKIVGTTEGILGKEAIVNFVTKDGFYANITVNGRNLGWVDTKSLSIFDDEIVDTNFNSYISSISSNIYSQPIKDNNFFKIGNTKEMANSLVQVKKQTADGKLSFISKDGKEIGWILSKDLAKQTLDETVIVTSGNYSVDNLPWGSNGYKKLTDTSKYLGKKLKKIASSHSGNYFLIDLEDDGRAWIDHRAFGLQGESYDSVIIDSNHSINDLPWNSPESIQIATTQEYINQKVKVIGTLQSGSYSLLSYNGDKIGWVDSRAVLDNVGAEIIYTKDYIGGAQFSITTLPWGRTGFVKTGSSSDIIGQEVTILAKTSNNSYYYVSDGTKGIGWIDHRALGLDKNNFKTVVIDPNYSINDLPWTNPKSKDIGKTDKFLKSTVQVIGSLQNNSYLLISKNGQQIGWVDYRSVLPENTEEITPYEEFIGATNFSVSTLPWGRSGSRNIGTSNDILGEKATVIAKTSNNSYYLVYINDRRIGWIDYRAFGLDNEKYSSMVIDPSYSINDLPWNNPKSRKVSSSSAYLNKNIEVLGTLQNGTYVLISQNNRNIGWVDYRAILPSNSKLINSFEDYILDGKFSIDTLPWGRLGFKKIGTTSSIYLDKVDVKAQTNNGAYSLIYSGSNRIGWIDSRAFIVPQNSEKKTILKKGYSIDSKPWGTPGYKQISNSANYIGEEVSILGLSSNKAYSAIALNGNFLGWIDNRAFDKKLLIYLDPGHGSSDTGAYYYGVAERDINLLVSNKIASRLRNLGYEVVMSRTTSQNVFSSNSDKDLYARPDHANKLNADIFVSVHHNAMPGNSGIAGIETYYYGTELAHPPLPENINSHNDPKRLRESRNLANLIHNNLINSTKASDRGVKTGAYVVVRESKMPAVLLELGYMSNQAELRKLTTDSYQNILADAIVKGINNYFGQ